MDDVRERKKCITWPCQCDPPPKEGRAYKEVGRHEQLQGDLGLDGEFGDFGRAIGVAQLVVEVLDDLFQDGGGDLTEVDLAEGLLRERACKSNTNCEEWSSILLYVEKNKNNIARQDMGMKIHFSLGTMNHIVTNIYFGRSFVQFTYQGRTTST